MYQLTANNPEADVFGKFMRWHRDHAEWMEAIERNNP